MPLGPTPQPEDQKVHLDPDGAPIHVIVDNATVTNGQMQSSSTTVVGDVTVKNAGSALHVTVDNPSAPVTFPAQQHVIVDNQASGSEFPESFAVSNFPATQQVAGTVTVANPTTSITVSNLPVTQAVSGSVSVSNLPASQHVTVDNPTSTVAVSNLPTTQTVAGTVAVSNIPAVQHVVVDNPTTIPSTMAVSNFPATQPVTVSNTPAVTVTGVPHVIVDNPPVSQPVSGTVSVGNFPSTQQVSGTVAVTGAVTVNNPQSAVSVNNFPASQSVTGSVTVLNPTTSVGVNNFPSAMATQARNEYVYTGSVWEPIYSPQVFKTITLTAAGTSALWTPATGKRFRLMGYSIQVTNGALLSAAGTLNVTFFDGTGAIGIGYSTYLQGLLATVSPGAADSGDIDLGNGYVSQGLNFALGVNLSAAVTGGLVRVNVRGIEY